MKTEQIESVVKTPNVEVLKIMFGGHVKIGIATRIWVSTILSVGWCI